MTMAKESKLATPTRHDHDYLVALTAAKMRSNGMTHIKASHIANFSQCSQIGDYIPDATAFIGNAIVIAEAESQEGLAAAHTTDQWEAFHANSTRYGGHFIAVVNKADETTARTLLIQVCGGAANAILWVF